MKYPRTVRVYVIALFGTLIALPLVAIAAFWLYAHFIENPRFARLSFENSLEFDKVLASRRWHWGAHPWGSFYFGCTYAIVNLPDKSPTVPPQSWSVPWTQTPVRISNGRHDALDECLYFWPDDLGHRLIRAHDTPGAYYASTIDTLVLYAPAENLAAQISFGDYSLR